jgi:endoglucanase
MHHHMAMEFTHQGAAWSQEAANLPGINWGTEEEKRKVYVEFKKVEMAAGVRYRPHLGRTAERLGWAWTYWQSDSDFVAWDTAKDDWAGPIREELAPQGESPVVSGLPR